MKQILILLLLVSYLSTFAKDKKKDGPEPAFKKGILTATAAYGYPAWSKSRRNAVAVTNTFLVLADYQLSRQWTVGVKYVYHYQSSKTLYYNSYVGASMEWKNWSRSNVFMATASYCYLNRGRVSLSAGIGLGIEDGKYYRSTMDSNGKQGSHNDVQRNAALEIRLVDARVMLKNNFSLYGSVGFGPHGVVAAGASYNLFANKPMVKKDKKHMAEPAFSKGAVSLIAAYGSPALFGIKQNTYYKYPGNAAFDVQYQLSRRFNAGLHYGYVNWNTGMRSYVYPNTTAIYRDNTLYRVHDIMATSTYTYLNRGRVSLGIGAAIGLGLEKGRIHIIDTAGVSLQFKDTETDKILVYDVRFVEAKVNLGSGFGLYGCLGTRSVVTAGVHFTFNNHKEY